jgi:hypothetical protein
MPLYGAVLRLSVPPDPHFFPRHSILWCYWLKLPDRAFIYNWRTNNPMLDRTEMDKISSHLADRPLKTGVMGR